MSKTIIPPSPPNYNFTFLECCPLDDFELSQVKPDEIVAAVPVITDLTPEDMTGLVVQFVRDFLPDWPIMTQADITSLLYEVFASRPRWGFAPASSFAFFQVERNSHAC